MKKRRKTNGNPIPVIILIDILVYFFKSLLHFVYVNISNTYFTIISNAAGNLFVYKYVCPSGNSSGQIPTTGIAE